MINYKSFIGVLVAAFLLSCNDSESPQTVTGLKPIYGTVQDLSSIITVSDPQPIEVVGKIYTKGNLLYINDVGKGVHVVENSDRSNPEKIKFITIPGNVDIAIRGNFMYADLGSGIVTLDISNLDDIKFLNFNNGYLEEHFQIEPPSVMLQALNGEKVYYECPDKSKGQIIAWVKEEMPKPQCYINR